ncbi:MAG: hypothetical protein HFI29_08735 [Lachnospiraceae bacterium]|jgi:hypothetical protein|nr:hypothetical protein [Lachnospiraceae bacterium]
MTKVFARLPSGRKQGRRYAFYGKQIRAGLRCGFYDFGLYGKNIRNKKEEATK